MGEGKGEGKGREGKGGREGGVQSPVPTGGLDATGRVRPSVCLSRAGID